MKELGCGPHHSPSFVIQLKACNRQALQSLKLQKMLSEILVLCQSVDTSRRDVHHNCLQGTRCLTNHSFGKASTAFITSG